MYQVNDKTYNASMSSYRRHFVAGATYFFTLVTMRRRPILCTQTARDCLRRAIEETQSRRPFELLAICLLPDHLHCLWTLPDGDADFSTRLRKIKESFTRAYLTASDTWAESEISIGQQSKGLRGVWQQRFWEHTIRDETDFGHHLDYIHFNPIKHELAPCAHAWPYSTFSKWVALGLYDSQWCCSCRGDSTALPDFSGRKFGE